MLQLKVCQPCRGLGVFLVYDVGASSPAGPQSLPCDTGLQAWCPSRESAPQNYDTLEGDYTMGFFFVEIQESMCDEIKPGVFLRKLSYGHTKVSICQTNKTEELGNGGANSYSLNQQETRFLSAHQHKALTVITTQWRLRHYLNTTHSPEKTHTPKRNQAQGTNHHLRLLKNKSKELLMVLKKLMYYCYLNNF